jgi:hypothetical protein
MLMDNGQKWIQPGDENSRIVIVCDDDWYGK